MAASGVQLKGRTDDGQTIHIHIPQVLAWVLGLSGTALVAGVALLISLNLRLTVLEDVAVTETELNGHLRGFVGRQEYQTRWDATLQRLDRIDEGQDRMDAKLDRILEGR